MNGRKVVVTGATGLLGSNVVRQLLAGEDSVTALVRDVDRARRLLPTNPRLTLVEGDVTEPASVIGALRGADAVVHTAAYFREFYGPHPDLARLEQVNVTAVSELLGAASDAGIGVVVHTSTHGLLAPPASGEADENSPSASRNAYFDSKARAEQEVRRFCSAHELRVPIIMPGWMWGPGDSGPTSSGKLFLDLANQRLPAVPQAANQVVDARDVADACVQALDRGQSCRRYIVAGTRRTLPELAAGVGAVVGVPAPRTVPLWAAWAAASLLEARDRVRRRQPVTTRASVATLFDAHRRRVSSARAQRELGVTFRAITQTLQAEADWFEEHGLLPGLVAPGPPATA